MPKLTEIKAGQRSTDSAEEMAEAIKDVIYRYEGSVPLALAIGVLEVVKAEIIFENG